MAGDPKTGGDKTATDDRHDDPPDAGEVAESRRKDGGDEKPDAAPGAIPPDELTTESDDGAG